MRSVTVAPNGSLAVAANNKGKQFSSKAKKSKPFPLGNCYVWQLAPQDTSKFEPIEKIAAHQTYLLKCLFSPDRYILLVMTAAWMTIL